MKNLLPVTVLSGFLGAGKTTILKSLLLNTQGMKIAVIVNDMAEINIDAQLVEQGAVLQVEEQLIEMSNGCICCTLRDDLLESLSLLASKKTFDYVLIEGSGISEPLPVAQTFSFTDKKGNKLQKSIVLDTLVTVIDPINLLKQIESDKTLKQLKMAATKEDMRSLSELIIEQIEFANILIITKTDLANSDIISRAESFIERLNPHAKILKIENGKIDPNQIMNTKLFDMEKSQSLDSWQDELKKVHIPETIEFGISSFTFSARKPFHPKRLEKFLNQLPKAVIRAKGWFWLDGDQDNAWYFSRTGKENAVGVGAPWYASIPEKHWNKEQKAKILSLFEGQNGDRRQELVFIGREMDGPALQKQLENCLMANGESFSGKNPFEKFKS